LPQGMPVYPGMGMQQPRVKPHGGGQQRPRMKPHGDGQQQPRMKPQQHHKPDQDQSVRHGQGSGH